MTETTGVAAGLASRFNAGLAWAQPNAPWLTALVDALQSVVPFLVEGLTELAIQRPQDALLWLSQYILDRSPAGGEYKIVTAKYVAWRGLPCTRPMPSALSRKRIVGLIKSCVLVGCVGLYGGDWMLLVCLRVEFFHSRFEFALAGCVSHGCGFSS